MLTVVEQLRLNGTLDSVGGTAYVAQLTMEVASAANVEFHARIVAQKYLSRQLIGFAANLETKAFDESIDVDRVSRGAMRPAESATVALAAARRPEVLFCWNGGIMC